MNPFLALFLVTVGVILQLILIKVRITKVGFTIALVIILVALLPYGNESKYNLGTHILLSLISISIYSAVIHREKILKFISIEVVLVFTIIFWYLLLSRGINFERDPKQFNLESTYAFVSTELAIIVGLSIIFDVFELIFSKRKALFRKLLTLYILLLIISVSYSIALTQFGFWAAELITMLIAGIITILIFYNALAVKLINNLNKFIFYIWYLFILLVITIWNFNYRDFLLITQNQPTVNNNILAFILMGMSILFVPSIVINLMLFIPSKSKSESQLQMFKRLKKDYVNIISLFSNHVMSKTKFLIIIIFEVGVFTANYYLHFISAQLLVFIWLIVFPNLLYVAHKILKA